MYTLDSVCYETSGSGIALKKSNGQVSLKVVPGLYLENHHVQPFFSAARPWSRWPGFFLSFSSSSSGFASQE